ncbi:MAG: tRNA (adenosine(37)-N6)-dimethylallyltransferase MiaA, partial [Elusimicrobia bacterium]|nr:tRNA (adenosine(37)-N6)-dimethylallyltransferase MiaA [Elusimicrobiota bacterium]
YSRINKRCEDMINGGMLDEVKYVLNMGYDKNCYGLTGVGYKHIVKYFNNELNREELLKIFSQDTRHYAKRQITWFSRQQDIQIINIDDANAQDILTKLI